jgi:predicted ATP-dependent endonuclease of OLD family
VNIKNITIRNFKSIKDITIPIQSYGEELSKSSTTFFVGINESGKSAILEAISLINVGFKDIDYENYCHAEARESNDYISIYTELELTYLDFWKKQIVEKLKLSEDFVNRLEILSINKNTYIKNETYGNSYNITISGDLPFFQYVINKTQKVVTGQEKPLTVETIELLSDINKIEVDITEENAKSFLNENQSLLTKEILESKIAITLKLVFDINMPKIQIWRPSPQYLINGTVDLDKFKEDTKISIPLKNIFLINGKTSDEEIKNSIERALSDQARCDELKEKMGSAITKYINKVWKEHKIKIKISINGTNCEVHVEDKDKEFVYYTMDQRSDGFKQFISLILSLSTQNKSNVLKGNIILIDEPEIYLHPSGIKYMRDEILKIGENNHVFVATHSNYMVDTNVRERHWIVKKEKAETTITQMNDDYNFTDEEVLSAAFGLDIFKELLPPNIIIVEGADDRDVFSHAIHLLDKSFLYSIKAAGGASKMSGFAQLLKDEKVNPFLLFDADKEGMDKRKKILDEHKDFYFESNVFTLKSLFSDLPTNATTEDLLPHEFVKTFFDKEMESNFNFKKNECIIIQLKKQSQKLNEDKQKLDSLKMKLAISFCNEYKSEKDLREKAPKLVSVVTALFSKIEEFNRQ